MRIIIIGALLFASATVQAQDAESELDRFRLYTGCAPVSLLVEGLPIKATEIGLFKDDILTTVRSRLRGARIYSSNPEHTPYLYVNVNVVGHAFSIKIALEKYVTDLETELIFPAQTWQSGITGTYGGQGSGYILQSIGQTMDLFIDEYLAVNESACE